MDWYPGKPTLAQVAMGIVCFLALAALALYWSVGEAGGNRIFLWIVAGLCLLLGTWRVSIALRILRERGP